VRTRTGGRRPWSAAATCAAIAAAALAIGCGDSDDGGGAPTTASSSSGEIVAESRRIVDAASRGFVIGTGEPFVAPSSIQPLTEFEGPKPLRRPRESRSVAVLSCLPVGACLNVTQQMAGIFREFGWEVSELRGDGSPSKYQQLFSAAIAKRPDAIVVVGIPGIFVGPQLEEANRRGIVTIAANQIPASGKGFDGYVSVREDLSKELLAAAAIADSGGEAKAELIDVQGRPDMGTAAGAAFFERCSGCDVGTTTMSPVDLVNPATAQQKIRALVTAKRDLDYLVYPTAGIPMQPAVQAMASAGVSDSMALVASDLDPAALDLVHKGQVRYLTLASQTWLALASVDATLRGLAKKPMPGAQEWGIGVSLVTKENAPKGRPSYPLIERHAREIFDYAKPYEEAWGVRVGGAE
jgi:ABC-type sugar transport system substrate-binding protein